jgi:hypothetical protein
MNRPLKLLYLMNIPSPYRWHLFSRLRELGLKRDIDFSVAFMTEQSRHRPWRLSDFPQTFPVTLPWGINLSKRDDRLLNPGLIGRLLYAKWDGLFWGGYDNPTTAFLATLPFPVSKSN